MTIAELARQEGFSRGLEEGKTFAQRAREEGFSQGLEEGKAFAQHARQDGFQKGIQQGMQLIAMKLLAKGLTLDIISEATGLTISELEKLRLKCEV